MRVYDAQTPVNHLLQEGVFKLESRGGDLRKATDCDPQLGISRIVIVNLQSNTWAEMKGTAILQSELVEGMADSLPDRRPERRAPATDLLRAT